MVALSEGQDRGEITLPGAQNELAKAIVAANPKTVVVLINGGMVAIDDLKAQDHIAIVEAFYPGFYGADALAETVFGFSNRWGNCPQRYTTVRIRQGTICWTSIWHHMGTNQEEHIDMEVASMRVISLGMD